jgi:tyramine---L-glutamate ligase
LKIFVCEFITGGGLYREALPDGLLKEGLLMRDALLTELAEVEGAELSCSCDVRVQAPTLGHVTMIREDQDVWQLWRELIDTADAVFVIAPETSGILLRLSQMVIEQDKLLLGCPPSVVKLTTSKLATYHAIKNAGISAVPSYSAQEWLNTEVQTQAEHWVIKPDDGVGCEDIILLSDKQQIVDWLTQGKREFTHIVQPLWAGESASLSMLCRDGQAWLLSCNRQKVTQASGKFRYQGSLINDFSQYWALFEALAQKIARASPDLNGYIGVDLMVGEGDFPELAVLEINPRLTTSYVGLHEATGLNIASELLKLVQVNSPYTLPKIAKNKIEITL